MPYYQDIIGQHISIIIDRPLGSTHPQHSTIIYPINYGYVEGIFAPDGEEQDVYLLGVYYPISAYQATVIAVIQRYNDTETKWVAAPVGILFSKEEIEKQVYFQEQFFQHDIFC